MYFAMLHGLMDNSELEVAYYDSSRLMLEDRLKEFPDDSRLYSSLGIAYAGLGRKEDAITSGLKAVELLPIHKDAYMGPYRIKDLGRIYVMSGEFEKALEQLDILLSVPGIISTKLLQLDPTWKPLWNHPEFIQLMEKYSEN